MNKKIIKLLEQATKKYQEAEAAEQKLARAVTYVGFEPDDEPRITYFGADYIVFKNFWSSGRYFTWTRSNNKWKAGCFHGTGEELINKAYVDSEKSGREYERVVRHLIKLKKY